ncbi:putative Lipoprotein [Alteromonas macleodii]
MHACRCIAALSSTICSLLALVVTFTLSLGTTAITAKVAPSGFQHFEQPQAWLCKVWAPTETSTLFEGHKHSIVPPEKF